MALENLTPVTRKESILDGDDISPVTRMEYFLGKAANEVPKPEGVSDVGKVLAVNAAGDGFELDTPSSGLPAYTSADKGKVLTLGEGSASETVVIVPEQTVTTEYDDNSQKYFAIIQIDDKSIPSQNYTYTMSVNGESYTCDIEGGWLANNQYMILPKFGTDDFIFVDASAASSATYTISLTKSVPSVEPKWERIIPDYASASEGDVLTIENGVPVWKATSPN